MFSQEWHGIMTKFSLVGKKMRFKIFLINIALILTLTHCASYDFSRRVVRQGNLLPEKKIARLQLGMSKEEVAILMGTSLLSPTFTNNRWDYVHTCRKGNNALLVRNLSLYFTNNKLTHIERRL